MRLRATPHMRMLGLIILLMAIAAINYQSNAAWALVMALVAVLGVSVLHTRRNLALVRVVSCRCPPVFAQEEAQALVMLTAAGLAAADITVAIPQLGPATGSCAEVPAEGVEAVTCRVPGRGRGVTRVSRVRITTTYPFGLLSASWEQSVEADCVVYPAALGPQLLAAQVVSQLAVGMQSTTLTPQAGTDDFSGHRRFSAGDPRTLIDWKAHARGGQLLIKRFTGAATNVVWCEWQAAQGGREARLSQLAAWLVAAQRGGWRFGLRLPGREVPPDQGLFHLHACLLLLAEEPG